MIDEADLRRQPGLRPSRGCSVPERRGFDFGTPPEVMAREMGMELRELCTSCGRPTFFADGLCVSCRDVALGGVVERVMLVPPGTQPKAPPRARSRSPLRAPAGQLLGQALPPEPEVGGQGGGSALFGSASSGREAKLRAQRGRPTPRPGTRSGSSRRASATHRWTLQRQRRRRARWSNSSSGAGCCTRRRTC